MSGLQENVMKYTKKWYDSNRGEKEQMTGTTTEGTQMLEIVDKTKYN